jgi:hypothetical protein
VRRIIAIPGVGGSANKHLALLCLSQDNPAGVNLAGRSAKLVLQLRTLVWEGRARRGFGATTSSRAQIGRCYASSMADPVPCIALGIAGANFCVQLELPVLKSNPQPISTVPDSEVPPL